MIKGDWTISFLWRPESSWREIHGTLPIATVRLLDNSYATLSYEATYDVSDNRTGGKFVLADGTNTIEITANDGWLFADVLKFAIVHEDGVGVTLYVETPAEGTLDESDGSMDFDDYVHFVQFSANASGEVKGLGAYGDVKFYDSNLSAADVQKIFDLDPTAPTAALTQRADQMVFARDSEAYRFNFAQGRIDKYDPGKVQKTSWPVFQKPTVTIDNGISNRHVIMWPDGDKMVTATSIRLLESDDASNFATVLELSEDPFASDCANHGGTYLDYVITSGRLLDDGSKLLNARYSDETSLLWRYDPVTDSWSHVLTLDGWLATWSWCGVRGNEIILAEYGPGINNPDMSKRVYYSNDYGATWHLIHTVDKSSGDNLHLHFATWHPTHTDIAYVSIGDGYWRQMLRLDFSGADKTDPANWQASNLGLNIQPTTAYPLGNKLLFGLDGEGTENSTLSLFDPATNRTSALLMIHLFDGTTEVYQNNSIDTYVWDIKQLNGIYYAAMRRDGGDGNGLYASIDGLSWTRVIKGDYYQVFSDSAGRLWLQGSNGTTQVPVILDAVNAKSCPMASARRAYTNILSADNSFMESSIGDWYQQDTANVVSDGLSSQHSFFGANSYEVVLKGFMRARLYLTLQANKYYLWSGFLRLPDELIEWYQDGQLRPYLQFDTFLGTGLIKPVIVSNAVRISDNWYFGQCWFKSTDGSLSGVMVRIIAQDFNFPVEGLPFHIDGAQLIETDQDLFMSGQFQPGGTPRADEILIAPAYDVGRGGAAPAGYVSGRGFVS